MREGWRAAVRLHSMLWTASTEQVLFVIYPPLSTSTGINNHFELNWVALPQSSTYSFSSCQHFTRNVSVKSKDHRWGGDAIPIKSGAERPWWRWVAVTLPLGMKIRTFKIAWWANHGEGCLVAASSIQKAWRTSNQISLETGKNYSFMSFELI